VPGSTGQKGDVWFIGSGFEEGEISRTITIPYGTKLFVPLFNVEASTVEIYEDEQEWVRGHELTERASAYMPDVVIEKAEIDGVDVKGKISDAPSSVFKFGPLPDDNVLQYLEYETATEGTVSQSAADGYYMMVAPLSPGVHKIEWISNYGDGAFVQDVEYTVIVEPNGEGG
jgi:hypothetical protein